MIARVVQMVMEDRHMTVKQIAANAGISVGSVDTILHDDLREKRPKKAAAVLFHHDSAAPHRAARVHQFFDDNNFEVVPHAPYSPDLAPSDFWLIPPQKDTLRGRTFASHSALATPIFQWSQRTPKEAFAAAMQSWRQRCKKCVRLQSGYVEK
jgi:histone-lysine N-methyltransferase SETMAR